MGAHATGEKASELATQIIPHTYHKHAAQGPVAALRKAFIEANASIHSRGQQNREFEGMGTTGTALLLQAEGIWVGHVGDSRAYRIRDGVIEQLTFDHSLVWVYAKQQRIDPDKVENIPHNVIVRSLGPEPLVQVDIEGPHPLRPGDIYVLCSDGLSGQVTDQEMGAVATALPPAEACRFLVDLSNLRGGPDNITVVIARVGQAEPGQAPPSPPRRRRSFRAPWWALSLIAGTLLAVLATYLVRLELGRGAAALFVFAVAAYLAGLLGLFLQYRQDQAREESDEDRPPAKPHRRRPCKVERPLLDRLIKALKALRQRADEKQWSPDWPAYNEHNQAAEALLAQGDVPGAFREYCRAMLPLTRALHERRQKEEVFQPVWDKTR